MAVDWTAVSAIAAAVSAIGAAVAAYLSLRVMSEAKDIAAKQRASEFVKRYLELAIQFPKLSTEGSVAQQEQQQYEWFVNFTLMMAREVLSAHPNDLNWRTMMFEQLSYNEKELRLWRKDKSQFFARFGPAVEQMVDNVLAGKKIS